MNGFGWTVKMFSFGSKATWDGMTFYERRRRRSPVNFLVLALVIMGFILVCCVGWTIEQHCPYQLIAANG
jgi:hypothetical protein